MTYADIYERVSTEEQEREGSSLQTQREAWLKYCRDKGYEVARCHSGVFSGLSLDRPKLNELRERVRAGDVDVLFSNGTAFGRPSPQVWEDIGYWTNNSVEVQYLATM